MKTTEANMTTQQINDYRGTALGAGRQAEVDQCDAALRGDKPSRAAIFKLVHAEEVSTAAQDKADDKAEVAAEKAEAAQVKADAKAEKAAEKEAEQVSGAV